MTIGLGVLLLHAPRNRLHLAIGGGHGDARPEPGHDVEEMISARIDLLRRQTHRDPIVDVAIAEYERTRGHADHFVLRVVHHDGAAEDAGIAVIAALPQRVADDNNLSTARVL